MGPAAMISRKLTEQDAAVIACVVAEIAYRFDVTLDAALDTFIALALRQPDPEA